MQLFSHSRETRFKNSTVINQANLVEPYSEHVLLSSDFQHRFQSLFLTLRTTTVRNRGGIMWPPGPGAGQALPAAPSPWFGAALRWARRTGASGASGAPVGGGLRFPSQPATSSEEKESLHRALPHSSHRAAHSIPALLLHLSPSHFSDSLSSQSGSDGLLRAAGARALTGFARSPPARSPFRAHRHAPRGALRPPPCPRGEAGPRGQRPMAAGTKSAGRGGGPRPRGEQRGDPGAGPWDAPRRRSQLRARARAAAGASRDAELTPGAAGPFPSAPAANRAERPGHLHGGRRFAPLRAPPPPAALPGPRPGGG